MLVRYLKAQAMVLLCGGLVGPIFLIVYFALGPMARPYIGWMFYVGLLVTAGGVLVALWLANNSAKSAVRHNELTQRGVLVLAQINGISDTSLFVNDQQMIKVSLHFEVPGQPGFDAQESMASSPTRMQILNAHHLVALVEPGTQKYEIDWNASALIAGVVPAQFTLAEDNKTYDLRGQAGPLMEIMQILKANNIPMNGTIDVRSNPAVRQQVMAVVRRSGRVQPVAGQAYPPPPAPSAAAPSAPAPVGTPAPFTAAPPAPSTAQRLQELETLRAMGTVNDTEYAAKRQQIISEL
jgi:hypothetical protein